MPNFRPVDTTVLNAALARPDTDIGGRLLHLAAQAGLSRTEISDLRWRQVREYAIILPLRTVPIDVELAAYLRPLRESPNTPVIHAPDSTEPIPPQTISHLARKALENAGLKSVRMTDLRGVFVRSLLDEGLDWQEVSRITGFPITELRCFGVTGKKQRTVRYLEAAEMSVIFAREGNSPAGIALALSWYMGLRLEEIIDLRWEQVQRDRLLLNGVSRPMPQPVRKLLSSGGEGYIISTGTGRPFDRARLSRSVRRALVCAGLDDLTLRDIRILGGMTDESMLLDIVQGFGSMTLRQIKEEFNLTDTAARRLTRRMIEDGSLTRIGARYYPANAVVPPHRQETVILEYIRREGFAYRQDVSRLLRIPPTQCQSILRRMVNSGRLCLSSQRYTIVEDEESQEELPEQDE